MIVFRLFLSLGRKKPYIFRMQRNTLLELPRDAYERGEVVATGVTTFMKLLSSGVYPGLLESYVFSYFF